MAKKNNAQPVTAFEPSENKTPRTSVDPSGFDNHTLAWRFSVADLEGEWGWRTAAARDWWSEILPKLQHFETMTWADLMRAAGGREHGNNHHSIGVEELTKSARDRLAEIGQDDVDDIFSLRLTSTKRIYGIRDRRALKLLWYDVHHGNNGLAVVPVKRR